MSLLVPDYSSSSEDEDAPRTPAVSVSAPTPVPAPAPAKAPSSTPGTASKSAPKSQQKKAKKKKAKKKATLYLPPEIQRLLETGGGALSDDSDDDNELLAKHKRAKKIAGKRPRQAPDQSKDSVLSFLPPPKHELPAAEAVEPQQAAETDIQDQSQHADVAATAVNQQTEADAAAWQQYYYQQQQYQAAQQSESYYYGQGEEDVAGGSSKRKRTRERDIERALQQGNLDSVAGQLTDVQGPSPNAWQPPSEPLSSARGASGSGDQEVKVKASFWNTQTGGKVASVKPSRLQRQKHQLNQLAFDAKLRDFELLDKRGTAMKTKRETYAKYGW